MTTFTVTPAIALDVHICDQRRTYRVEFYGEGAEDAALAFITKRYEAKGPNGYGNHAIHEIEDEPLGQEFTRLIELLYPTCPHGLSLNNCYGPQHYYFDEEEQAAGHRNGW